MANPAPGFQTHPNHNVGISPPEHKVRVSLAGTLIADTARALRLDEDRYPARYYLPKSDVEMAQLTATGHATHCPFKGDARYWNVQAGGTQVDNGAWAYDAPFDECAALVDHIAFYGEQFKVEVG